MLRIIRVLASHGIALAIGFVLGIYLLPILVAPEAPSDAAVRTATGEVIFEARFTRDLPGSDFLHWGEGKISISARRIGFTGSIAPGPDYQLYLTRELALDEESFLRIKSDAVKIGAVKTFDNFLLDIPVGVDPADYRALIVWCETFAEFITAASYR